MRLIRLLLRQSRGIVVLAGLASLLSGVANAGLLAILNRVLSSEEAVLSSLTWTFFTLCVAAALLRFFAEAVLIRLGQRTLRELRLELSRRCLKIELRQLEELGAHRILSALTTDIPAIANTINVIPVLFFNLTVIVACFVYLFVISPTIFLIILGGILLGILCYQLPLIRAQRRLFEARKTNDVLYENFQALLAGMKELKLHRKRRVAFLDDVLSKSTATYERLSVAGLQIWGAASSVGQMLIFFIVGFLAFFLPLMWPEIPAATVGSAILVFIYLMQPLQFIMNMMSNFGRADVSLRRTEQLGVDLRSAEGPESAAFGTLSNLAPWHTLELAGATHTYRREDNEMDFVLGPIDLKLHPGQVVFLVGGNGSGKTTMAKMLLGLYLPDQGEILLDGEPVSTETIGAYRELFSAVFSDFFLFEELLGLESPELDIKARGYLKRLLLNGKVKVQDGVLSTTGLSQGQRKRLALLTAYLEDRPIYLFDEWAADQDPLFKDIFYNVLLPDLKARGKTIIVISHDDAYFSTADRVIKLNYGQLELDSESEPALATS